MLPTFEWRARSAISAMALDLPRRRVLVTDPKLRSLFAVDLETRHAKLLVDHTPFDPSAVAVDPTDQSVFIGCDGCIMRLDEETATHTVVAGSGADKHAMTGRTPARLFGIRSLVIDRSGAVFVADWESVRRFERVPVAQAPASWLLDTVRGGWKRSLPTLTLDGSGRRLIIGYAGNTAAAIDVVDLQTGMSTAQQELQRSAVCPLCLKADSLRLPCVVCGRSRGRSRGVDEEL
jgi:hypothetical protein